MICPKCKKRYVHERCYNCNPVSAFPAAVADHPDDCVCSECLPWSKPDYDILADRADHLRDEAKYEEATDEN